mmetsp:Transcript_29486/g.44569  ORF Transcript_29486/g.44569 Transcript_29486/m.44569 type:complete len:195 (+) Transcript_29486:98-682(+)|eukprot:CAMPEP_0194751984 /NCGR_PEP_ID=MMETSP0323_2-20130528/5872_1 /TAXON_ID=2866 ORGANISM="Crypthecodinium cohnii, Strain Seligo" /NCGR_SAMPLE_ID=MMETSP0323_2 /ASSEMBLY_ACC=CAM_ASM_000346 /LENGTH=194 /DNA_ID=CAMNT_0039668681 /DNA_START=27 /DNA_END=611 /DNA_ORIENTATION=-
MYLSSVLDTLSRKSYYGAEDLYKLNEAIFNLPENDIVTGRHAQRLFKVLETISKDTAKYCRQDESFFYDYVALIGCMQNQHFFSPAQSQTMLKWLHDIIGGKEGLNLPKAKAEDPKATAALKDKVAKLEKENAALQAELAQFRELSQAVQMFQTFSAPKAPKADAAKPAAAKKNKPKKAKKTGKKEEGETAQEE